MKPEDFASFRGRETETTLNGRTWKFSRWTLNVLDDFCNWAAKQLPDPLEVAEKAVLRLQRFIKATTDNPALDEVEKEFLVQSYREQIDRTSELAMSKASGFLAINSPEMQSLLNNPRGTAHLLLLLLKAHHPDATEEDAFRLAVEIPEAEMKRIMVTTMGKSPPGPAAPTKNPLAPAASR